MRALGPGGYLINTRHIGAQAPVPGQAEMIANGGAIDIRQPGFQQMPSCGIIGTNARLRQQFSGANAALMGVALPKFSGQLQAICQRKVLAPLAGVIVQQRGG